MPRRETEFIRPEMSFERDYLQVRNWWTRDRRIVGNPLSILLYLLSHRRDFRVTQSKVMRDLGLGKDAYLAARRKLERAGFLAVIEHRYPAGETDEQGHSIAGHKWTELVVHDASEPKTAKAAPGPAIEAPAGAFADIPPWSGARGASRSTRAAPAPYAENPPRRDPRQVACSDPESTAIAAASSDNPAPVHPLVKRNQPQEHHSSSSMTTDDDGPGPRPIAVPGLVSRLLRIEPSLDVDDLDLETAATEILAASPRRVGDPLAYVAASIVAEPHRWARNQSVDGVGSVAGRRSDAEPAAPASRVPRRPPTVRECASAGHRWIGTFREVCARCGEERPGWRDDRDTARVSAADVLVASRRARNTPAQS